MPARNLSRPLVSRILVSRILHATPRSVLKALALAAALGASASASAAEIVPYFQGWSPGTLVDARQAAGLDQATLAFAITRGSCVLDSYLQERMPDARAFVAAGGDLIVSLGGADGVYAEIACSDDQLLALLEKLIVDAGIRRIDWDVEGQQLSNVDATARRNRVLLRLQAQHPTLFTSFTLPSWLRGMPAEALNLLRSTVASGVRIDRVNVMVMSFGTENIRTLVSPPTVSQAALVAFQASAAQLAAIYPGKTPAQLRAMMGMTPMIGVNDDGATFTLADARMLADYVKVNGIGMLSYWSFQRDRAQASAGMGPVGTYSGVAQGSYAFLNLFKTAAGPVTAPTPTPKPEPTPAPAPAPPPIPAPAPAPACGAAPWVQGQYYAAGSIVTYNGAQYQAKYANPGYNPTISTYYWARYTATTWVQGQYYGAGSVVTYNGKLYRARYANPGYNPTISTYYWVPVAC